MGKKVNLPLFADSEANEEKEKDKDKSSSSGEREETAATKKKPSIDAARARLGGRTMDSDPPPAGFAPGVVVTFPLASGRRLPGVIVFASPIEVHVLLDGIRLRRFPPADLLPHEGDVSLDLSKIAGDARLFGQLVEGQSVRYADDTGNLIDGKVIEKCRWGALVLRDDGAVVAVGFRKIWPASPQGAAV